MKVVGSAVVVLSTLSALAPPAPAQQSRSVFDAATVVQFGVPFRRLADFDLDGDMDAVGVQLESPNGVYLFYVFTNNGGTFTSRGHEFSGGGAASSILLEVGRLNGDAWPDVCVIWGSQRHDWLGNAGRFDVEPPSVQIATGGVSTMALAELDGDGIDDLAWTDTSSLHLQISSGPADSVAVSGTKHSLRIWPLDGPFGSDVFVLHVNDDVRIFYGHPATGLVAGPVFHTGVPMAMVDSGDIDGDGDVDVVAFGATEYRVLRRTAQDWSLEPAVAGGPAEFLRDVDGDGDLDGACCGSGDDDGRTYESNAFPSLFQIALNDGSGTFAPSFPIPGAGSRQFAGAADIDLDGDIDLVAGLCVYYAHGPLRPLRTSAVVPPFTGTRSLSDCDGDGDIDVGFSVESVYSNDGAGAFVLEPTGAVAPPGTGFRSPGYPGDFDGDGDVDLVAEVGLPERAESVTGSPLGHHRPETAMALVRNDGQGGLLTGVPASALGVRFGLDDNDPENSVLADVDVDGDLDLLTRTNTYDFARAETRLWANDGAGFFVPGGRQTVSRAVWAGDVDLDGDMDMISAGSGYEGTSTYLYRGGNPQPGHLPNLVWTGLVWHQETDAGLAATDFDGNGYPDFAGTFQYWDGSVYPPHLDRVYAGIFDNQYDTGGSLALHFGLSRDSIGNWLTPVPARAARLSLGDLQDDGTTDAVNGPLALGDQLEVCTLSLQRTSGPPLVFDHVFQLVPPGHLVDLDGDGDLDILGARIVFNNRYP